MTHSTSAGCHCSQMSRSTSGSGNVSSSPKAGGRLYCAAFLSIAITRQRGSEAGSEVIVWRTRRSALRSKACPTGWAALRCSSEPGCRHQACLGTLQKERRSRTFWNGSRGWRNGRLGQCWNMRSTALMLIYEDERSESCGIDSGNSPGRGFPPSRV